MTKRISDHDHGMAHQAPASVPSQKVGPAVELDGIQQKWDVSCSILCTLKLNRIHCGF